MSKIVDKAEVAIDFPDKAYMGSFGRSASFQARATEDHIVLRLERSGEERRIAEIHLHYYLFADILAEIAESLQALPPIDEAHRQPLAEAAQALTDVLQRTREDFSNS